MPLVLAGTCDLGAHVKTMVAPELAAWVENTLSSANAEPDVIVSVLKIFFSPLIFLSKYYKSTLFSTPTPERTHRPTLLHAYRVHTYPK